MRVWILQPGETLKDFFGRTSMYWQMAAYDHTQHTGKELRKDGFDLAESRYKELRPVLDEVILVLCIPIVSLPWKKCAASHVVQGL